MASDIGDLFIIDDDAMMRDALSVVFTLAGYRVTGFVDGETFHAVASARTPAAVLLDLHLPAKSGLTVLKELDARSYPATIPIVRRCELSCRAGEKRCVRLSPQAA